MFRIDERRKRGTRSVIPFAGRCLATNILGGRDNLEVAILQLRVDFLPAWQIEAASSP